MSLEKSNYDTHKIVPGCPPKHPVITGENNDTGKVIDAHEMPERDIGWDGVRNSDIGVLSNRIVQLEKKCGLLGWNKTTSSYTLVPKSGSIPAYVNASTSIDKFVEIRKNNVDIFQTISGAVHNQNGETLVESLVALDRCIQVLEHKILGQFIDPRQGDEKNNFILTMHNASS